MNTVERIKMICKERKIAISALEKACGFSNGYISQLRKGTMPADRLDKVSEFLNLSSDYLLKGEESERYYINNETAEIAQQIFENKEMRVLFDAAKDAQPDDLMAVYDMLLALKRKERGRDQ